MQPPHLVLLEYFRGVGIGKMWFTVGAGAAGVSLPLSRLLGLGLPVLLGTAGIRPAVASLWKTCSSSCAGAVPR